MPNLLQRVSWCAAALLTSPIAFADVLTVGGISPAYPTIPAAVAAAVEGDVILVKAGSYTGFTIDAKGISVVANTGAAITITSTIEVRNLPASSTVVLSRLSLNNVWGTGLRLENNAGHVRVQGMFSKPAQYAGSNFWYAGSVSSCADVAFVDCTFIGRYGEGAQGYSHGGEEGLITWNSKVSLHRCTLTGGKGRLGEYYFGTFLPGTPGAPAFSGNGTVLLARGSSLTGGDGGNGIDGGQPPPACTLPSAGGAGGAGVFLTGAQGSSLVIASTCVGGIGGIGGTNLQCGNQAASGAPGAPIQAPPGGAATRAGPALHFRVPEPAREGQNVALHVEGPPGAVAVLLLGNQAGYASMPSWQGALLVAQPVRRIALGTIPASGFIDFNWPVPELGAGVEAAQLHAQTVFIVDGGTLLASPGVIVMLDAAF